MRIIKILLSATIAASIGMAQPLSVSISGIVTDTGTTPIAGVVVQLLGGPKVTTGADGRFSLVVGSTTTLYGNGNLFPIGLFARISRDMLTVSIAERSVVEVATFDLSGKSLSTVRTTFDAGNHSLSLPYWGAGIYMYKVKSGNRECVLKGNSIGGVSSGSAVVSQGLSSNPLAKQARSTADINYVIAASKSEYLNYRMIIKTADTSGINIKMTVGKGLAMAGLQRQIVMKNIPAGTFIMGSADENADFGAQPPHQVTLNAFAMQETDVTQEQYLAVTGTNPSYFNTGTGALLRPVEQVNWYDAVKYCNDLSLLSGLTAVYDTSTWTADFLKSGYRLPNEAQWEYACRAGSITEYWWGPDTNGMGARTWSAFNSDGTTQPVATKLANVYGLYDMTGNVWQWCNDWYAAYTAGAATDPTGAATGTVRVLRGGSWDNGEYEYDLVFHSAVRNSYFYCYLAYRGDNNGFRVVLPR